MKSKLFYFFLLFFLFSCSQDLKKFKKKAVVEHKSFSSKGFALIYEDSIFDKKIISQKLNNDQNYVLHKNLDNNLLINITNPLNSKSIVARTKKTESYPDIYKVVITNKMANDLGLDIDNPYVEIITIKKNYKFIAKKASIFDEEKNVANKAPVESIDINDMSTSSLQVENKTIKPSFVINVADFYFLESAENVKKRFKKEANLVNIKIKKISKNKFKVYSGPYDSFNSMKDTYFSLISLGFDNLDVIYSN